MAAGQGFKTFAVGEVLSAANVNGYLMQGVLVFASAAARDAAITSPSEGQFAYTKDTNGLWYYDGATWVASGATGDIEGVTAGTGISGGGTSGTVTITNSMATAIDAKGDLVVGTGSDTFARLAVGTNDYILTADSTASTGVKWAAAAGGSITYGENAINTNETTTSTSWTDLATVGPTVTITTGTKALVIISSACGIDTQDRGAYASYAISGATTKAASSQAGDIIQLAGPQNAYNTTIVSAAVSVVTLTAGSNVFTMKYLKGGPSGIANFNSRSLYVMRLN